MHNTAWRDKQKETRSLKDIDNIIESELLEDKVILQDGITELCIMFPTVVMDHTNTEFAYKVDGAIMIKTKGHNENTSELIPLTTCVTWLILMNDLRNLGRIWTLKICEIMVYVVFVLLLC